MNPILVILILLGGFLLWLLLAFAYIPIGKIFKRLADDAKRAMSEDDTKEETNDKGETNK